MESKRGKSVLVLMMSVLLLVLAVSLGALGGAAEVVEPHAGAVQVSDRLHGLLAMPAACPHAGGSSGA
jgi:hypothetical protein